MANNIKDITAPEDKNLGDVITALATTTHKGRLDRVRNVLSLRMNQYNDLPLTAQEVGALAKSFANVEVGTSTGLVLICSKAKCLYRDRCILFKNDKCPEDKECLHENKVLTYALDQYLQSLEVDINNYPELVLVNQLVEYELLEHRCNAILSFEHGDLKQEIIIGIDKRGEVVSTEQVSYALEIKDSIFKKKLVILQELTATRKEKYKKQAALKESKEGPAKVISSIKSDLDKMLRQQQELEERETASPLADEDGVYSEE
ncbi:MAG: hypothetical protein WC973_03540 [Candidatus Dojkabacteria bacterium]